MSKRKAEKAYWEMNATELAEATREFDGPIPASKMRPLTKAERAEFERLRAQPRRSIYLRPRKTREIKVQLDEELLRRSNEYASKHHMTLSEVINRGLKSALTFLE